MEIKIKLIELVFSYFILTENDKWNITLFVIVLLISYSIAFDLVSIIFNFFKVYDSEIMSEIHWYIRISVFFILTIIINGIIKIILYIIGLSWWVYIFAIVLLLVIVTLIYYFNHKNKKRKFANEFIQILKLEEKSVKGNHIESDYCPRCHTLLINRNGPYGKFWGCKRFPNCRYTRKYK